MFRPTLKVRHLLVAFLGFSIALSAIPSAFAQVAPTQTDPATEETAPEENEDTPIVPSTPFPSVIALDPTNQVWTLKVSGGRLKVNGDVAVDSTNRGALWMADSSIAVENGTIGVVGGISTLGRTSIDPSPRIGAAAVKDPLPQFRITPPERVISNEKLFLRTEAGGDDTTLPPGIYDGGIFATGDGHITMQPGVFVFTNGDFSAIGPTIEGEGITIIMAGNNAGSLSFSLGAKFNASAPTSGKMKDLLVVSRASGTFAKGVSFAVAQGQMQGILYCPTSSVTVLSKSRVQVSKIIAKSVDVTSGTLSVTGTTNGTQTGEGTAATAETTNAAP